MNINQYVNMFFYNSNNIYRCGVTGVMNSKNFGSKGRTVLQYFTVLEILTATVQKYHPRQSYDVR